MASPSSDRATPPTNSNAWLWSQPSGVQLLGALSGQDVGLTRRAQRRRQRRSPANPRLRRRDHHADDLDFGAGPDRFQPVPERAGCRDHRHRHAARDGDVGGRPHDHRLCECRRYGYLGWVLKTPTSAGLPCVAAEPVRRRNARRRVSQGLNEHLGHGDTLGPCPCVDADGDSYTTCGGDCNDTNSAVHAGASDAAATASTTTATGSLSMTRCRPASDADRSRQAAGEPACPGTP